MNRPRLFTRVLGFFPITALVTLAAVGIGYQWWTQPSGITDWAPIIAVFMIGMASNASATMTRYTNWNRAWDNMEGRPPPPRLHGLKAFCLLIPTVGMGWFVAPQLMRTHPFVDPPAIGLLLLFSVAFLYQLVQWQRHRPRTSKASKPGKPYTATICLPVAKPGPRPLIADLPPYCQSLLHRKV